MPLPKRIGWNLIKDASCTSWELIEKPTTTHYAQSERLWNTSHMWDGFINLQTPQGEGRVSLTGVEKWQNQD